MMSERALDYAIHSNLPGNPESPSSLGMSFVHTLDALTNIDPLIFKNWEIMDFPAKDSVPLAVARSRIGVIIEKNVDRDQLGEAAPSYGYHAVAFTGNVSKSRKINLRINAGGKNKGGIWLETGSWRVAADPAIVTYPIFKSALLAIEAFWPSAWANAYVRRLGHVAVPIDVGAAGAQAFRIDSPPQVPTDPSFPKGFHIPWLAYLSAKLAADLKLAPEILTERTPDGGLLMTATEDRIDPDNPEHLRRARILAETMIACTRRSSD
jgi:hypothetical protein